MALLRERKFFKLVPWEIQIFQCLNGIKTLWNLRQFIVCKEQWTKLCQLSNIIRHFCHHWISQISVQDELKMRVMVVYLKKKKKNLEGQTNEQENCSLQCLKELIAKDCWQETWKGGEKSEEKTSKTLWRYWTNNSVNEPELLHTGGNCMKLLYDASLFGKNNQVMKHWNELVWKKEWFTVWSNMWDLMCRLFQDDYVTHICSQTTNEWTKKMRKNNIDWTNKSVRNVIDSNGGRLERRLLFNELKIQTMKWMMRIKTNGI